MSDTGSSGAPTPSQRDDRTLVFVVYALMFVSPFVVGLTALIGVVIAYVRKPESEPIESSHYRYQIRAFWGGFALAMVAAVALVIGVGFLFVDVIRYLWANMPADAWETVSQDVEVAFPVVTFISLLISAFSWVAAGFWMILASVLGAVRLSASRGIGRLSA